MATVNYAKMTEAELKAVQAEYNEAAEKFRQAQAELNRREMEKQDKECEEKRAKLFGSEKFKKLVARYNAAVARIDACDGEQSLTINIPVTFTYSVDTYDLSGDDCMERDIGDVFERSGCEATIDKSADLTKAQRALLQQGLERVVANACEQIYELFPAQNKELNAAVAEYNRVMETANSLDESITCQDLEDGGK